LIFSDFQLLDAAGPIAVFDAARECAAAPYWLRVMTNAAGRVTSSSGAQLMAKPLSEDPVDTLIVTGGRGTREASTSRKTLAFVRATADRARRIASVCTEAFILAAAGLLDGRRATTHWSHSAELTRLYQQIRVEPDRIFIRDSATWTSAGVTAGTTSPWHWSPTISARPLPNEPRSSLSFIIAAPAGNRNFRRCSKPTARTAGFLRCWHGPVSDWLNGFRSIGWRIVQR
jgi:putative intracellular protease/amidase